MTEEAIAFESWVGSETSIGTTQLGSSWDICQLGLVYLPGVITIEDFEYGQDIDIQKQRKKEKCRIRDNGLAPCAFNIKCELKASQWPDWLKVLPSIQPRREGGIRSPLRIVHPLPNAHNVQNIYVHKIKIDPPSARKGMVITIKVAEWFEEAKDTNASIVPPTAGNGNYTFNYFGDPRKLAKDLRNSQGMPAEDAETILDRTFGNEGALAF